MCRPDRCTDSRGRPALLRLVRARVRRLRRALISFADSMTLLLLAFLADDVFLDVLDTLALVRLGRPVGAELRRHLTDLLLVGAADQDAGRLLALHGNALW